MFQLNDKHKEIFANKILDIGALAIGALIFGQFLSETGFQWGLTTMGILILIICYFINYFLLK